MEGIKNNVYFRCRKYGNGTVRHTPLHRNLALFVSFDAKNGEYGTARGSRMMKSTKKQPQRAKTTYHSKWMLFEFGYFCYSFQNDAQICAFHYCFGSMMFFSFLFLLYSAVCFPVELKNTQFWWATNNDNKLCNMQIRINFDNASITIFSISVIMLVLCMPWSINSVHQPIFFMQFFSPNIDVALLGKFANL